jgi:general nucleoside transport system ATP-binding protein
MVHQAFKLFPSLSVAENVVYRDEPRRFGLVDRRRAEQLVADLALEYGLHVDPTAKVDELPVGVLQRVEILKALYRDARVLILDEPTAVLTPQERDGLFAVLRRLREGGHTIIFITHKLHEVMALCDRVTVLRDGRSVAVLDTATTDRRTITHHMTGRDVSLGERAPAAVPGGPRLEVTDLRIEGPHGLAVVDDVDLTVRHREILGIAAIAGNGQNELVEAITGQRRVDRGRVVVDGQDITAASVRERREAGLSYIPEDRHRVGTAGAGSTRENLLMGYQRHGVFQQRGWLKRDAVKRHAARLIDDYGIRVASQETPVGTLSGATCRRWSLPARSSTIRPSWSPSSRPVASMSARSSSSTRGCSQARDAGSAVVLISAELWELLALSTRIVVLFEGRVVGEFDPSTTDEVTLGIAHDRRRHDELEATGA